MPSVLGRNAMLRCVAISTRLFSRSSVQERSPNPNFEGHAVSTPFLHSSVFVNPLGAIQIRRVTINWTVPKAPRTFTPYFTDYWVALRQTMGVGYPSLGTDPGFILQPSLRWMPYGQWVVAAVLCDNYGFYNPDLTHMAPIDTWSLWVPVATGDQLIGEIIRTSEPDGAFRCTYSCTVKRVDAATSTITELSRIDTSPIVALQECVGALEVHDRILQRDNLPGQGTLRFYVEMDPVEDFVASGWTHEHGDAHVKVQNPVGSSPSLNAFTLDLPFDEAAFMPSHGTETVHAFWISKDTSNVGSTWRNPGIANGGWHHPFELQQTTPAQALAPVPQDGMPLIYVTNEGGIANASAAFYYDAGIWQVPVEILPNLTALPGSTIAAVERETTKLTNHKVDLSDVNDIDAFWIAPDGSLKTSSIPAIPILTTATPAVRTLTNPGEVRVAPPLPTLPPPTMSPIGVVQRLYNLQNVLWFRPDGAVTMNWTDPNIQAGSWNGGVPVAGPGAARDDSSLAIANNGLQAFAFWIGPSNAIFATSQTDVSDISHWSAPIQIPSVPAADGSPIAAAITKDRVIVLWFGPNRAIYAAALSTADTTGTWIGPFKIAHEESAGNDSPMVAVSSLFGERLDVFWIASDRSIVNATPVDQSDPGGKWIVGSITDPNTALPGSPLAASAGGHAFR